MSDQLERLLTPPHEVPDDQLIPRFYELKRLYAQRTATGFQPNPNATEAENAAAKMQWEQLDQRMCEVQCGLVMRSRRVIVPPKKSTKGKKTTPPVDINAYLSNIMKVS